MQPAQDTSKQDAIGAAFNQHAAVAGLDLDAAVPLLLALPARSTERAGPRAAPGRVPSGEWARAARARHAASVRAAPSRFAPKRARTEALDATMRAIGGAGYSPSVANVRVARRPRRAAPDAFVVRPI